LHRTSRYRGGLLLTVRADAREDEGAIRTPAPVQVGTGRRKHVQAQCCHRAGVIVRAFLYCRRMFSFIRFADRFRPRELEESAKIIGSTAAALEKSAGSKIPTYTKSTVSRDLKFYK
jgi:hypothetical protein